jgi:arginase
MRRTPYFVKIRTRLGLTHPPVGKTEPNIGVEFAPDAILSAEFLREFPGAKQSEFTFSRPEDIEKQDLWRVTAEESNRCIEMIGRNYVAADTQVAIGGDHSLSFCTILALLKQHDPSTFAYIHIDSHGDIASLTNSVSGNWHGMYLRPIFSDDFELPEIMRLVTKPIPPANLMYIGNLELDGDEPEFFNKHAIKNISVTDMRSASQLSMQKIEQFLKNKTHLHINIDIDAFDESIAPATGLPKKGGLLIDDLTDFIERVTAFPSISVDLVEVNPQIKGGEKTVTLAQSILRLLVV